MDHELKRVPLYPKLLLNQLVTNEPVSSRVPRTIRKQKEKEI